MEGHELICKFDGCDKPLKIHKGRGRQPEYCDDHKYETPMRIQIRTIPTRLVAQKKRSVVPICGDCKKPINSITMGRTSPTTLCRECKAKRHNEREKKRYHDSRMILNG